MLPEEIAGIPFVPGPRTGRTCPRLGARLGVPVHEAPEVNVADGKVVPAHKRAPKHDTTDSGMPVDETSTVPLGVVYLLFSFHVVSCLVVQYFIPGL